MNSDSLVHRFNDGELLDGELPEKFTYPFCYSPAPATRQAAGLVLEHISCSAELSEAFAEGKMLGVLVVKDMDGHYGFLAGFSGLAGGRSVIPYFVPPILDLADPEGYFKKEERSVSRLSEEILEAENSPEIKAAEEKMEEVRMANDEKVRAWKEHMAESKARRDAVRRAGADSGTVAALVRESQFEKAQLKRICASCKNDLEKVRREYERLEEGIREMKSLRQKKSEALQMWIFENMVVENALGQRRNIWQIFSERGLVPPGGTGECAAPKLLHYAYTHGLKPVAMGEFWYEGPHRMASGSQSSETRLHGRFYPSCTGKCGPLLGFMLQGLHVEENPLEAGNGRPDSDHPGMDHVHGKTENPPLLRILYEDDCIIAADKPSGMLSTPGKTGGASLQELLENQLKCRIFPVHRLDMDTSGVILFARDSESQRMLQGQFSSRETRKQYIALLEKPSGGLAASIPQSGTISLPLAADYYDRPRQKVDFTYGKESVTQYELLEEYPDSIKVLFRPLTGRTHQLRVHSAHTQGLGSPIKGDRLYGSRQYGGGLRRLFLHAYSIKIRHPRTGCLMEFISEPEF